MNRDPVVAQCFADGVDVAGKLIKRGLACDWVRFSGGHYSRNGKGRACPKDHRRTCTRDPCSRKLSGRTRRKLWVVGFVGSAWQSSTHELRAVLSSTRGKRPRLGRTALWGIMMIAATAPIIESLPSII
jgi:hypothetical protein